MSGKRRAAAGAKARKSPSIERMLAAELLDGVVIEGVPLSILAEWPRLAKFEPQDRAAAMRLAKFALRHLNRIDSVLSVFMSKPLKGRAKNSLRLSVAEIFCHDRAIYAVVDQGVMLMGERSGSRKLNGLANAVLRQVATEGRMHWTSAAANRLPKWMSAPIKNQFGGKVLKAIEAAHENGAPLDVTPSDPGSAEEIALRLCGELLPTGSIRMPRNRMVSNLPGYEEGRWWVQDMAAAVPARMLGDVSGKRILDMCAAPGGKTMQLASSGANVTACDISAARLELLKANLKRTGLSADIVEMDALKWSRCGNFDAVVVDAPCSSSGTIRRNPDIPFVRDEKSLGELTSLQDRLLEKAFELLKPGGVVLYCTCSLLAEEGELRVEKFLSSREIAVKRIDPVHLGLEKDWQTADGGIRLRPDYWPELGGMDGFYSAALAKI
ncbi:MAG: RsmB/NOP family class I SAM-dependent RNA methyltransferase [Albidovulum sp.]|nr:RsmB/NOP family class I SAM-dependent RNA methyltransferase [Albidovulum sp.]